MTSSDHKVPVAIGVDGCRAGWFFFRFEGSSISFGAVGNLAELVDETSPADCLLVDIPIGLSEGAFRARECDLAARRVLGGSRASSVFPAPCRQALGAASYEDAVAINRRVLGRGLSRQTWGIVPKIREVDELLAGSPAARAMIRETHPEVCFRGLLGGPMQHPKKSRDGFLERMSLLSIVEPAAEQMIAAAFLTHGGFEAARDDIVDAFVAAVCARGAESLRTLPERPGLDPRGLPMQIAYLEGIRGLNEQRG